MRALLLLRHPRVGTSTAQHAPHSMSHHIVTRTTRRTCVVMQQVEFWATVTRKYTVLEKRANFGSLHPRESQDA